MKLTVPSILFEKKSNKNYTFSIFFILIGVSLGANGKEYEQPKSDFTIGVGMISSQKPYKDIDRENLVIPFLNYENKYIQLAGPTLNFKFPSINISETQQVELKLTGKYDFGGYDDDQIEDTPILNGMDERKGSFWAGAKAKWKNDFVNVGVEWITDVSGDNKGQRASLELDKSWVLNNHFVLNPRIVAHWHDEKDVDYLYGVRAHEARADRPMYLGESAINFEYGLRGVYLYNRKHSAFIDVSATSLAKEIKESPIVDDSNQNQIIFGYMYRF